MTKHRQIAIDAGGADLLLRPRLAMAVAHQRQGGLVTERVPRWPAALSFGEKSAAAARRAVPPARQHRRLSRATPLARWCAPARRPAERRPQRAPRSPGPSAWPALRPPGPSAWPALRLSWAFCLACAEVSWAFCLACALTSSLAVRASTEEASRSRAASMSASISSGVASGGRSGGSAGVVELIGGHSP